MSNKLTLIKNARLIDPAKSKVEDGAVLFADTILDIGAISSAPEGANIIDAVHMWRCDGNSLKLSCHEHPYARLLVQHTMSVESLSYGHFP